MLFLTTLLPLPDPQGVNDQRVQHQEDAAGQEVNDSHMCPYEDSVHSCRRVAVPPHVRPPEEGHTRCQGQHQHHCDDLPSPLRVADLPVEEGVTQCYISVHGEGNSGPDGGVVGGEFSSADRAKQECRDFTVEHSCLQQEADKDDEEL